MRGLLALSCFIFSMNILLAQNGKGIWVAVGRIDSIARPIYFDGNNVKILNNSSYIQCPWEPFASILTSDTTYLYASGQYWKTEIGGDSIRFKSGFSIRDENNHIIENGDDIPGHPTITSGALFVPHPNGKDFCLFTLGYLPGDSIYANGQDLSRACKPSLYFNHIAKKEDGSFRVIEKNTVVCDDGFTEKMAACKHANGIDWWIMVHGIHMTNSFFRVLLTKDGLKKFPPQNIGKVYCSYCTPFDAKDMSLIPHISEMTFNMSGTRLAAVTMDNIIDLFDFDRCTGLLSNYQDLSYPKIVPESLYDKMYYKYMYTTAFSKDDKFLYISHGFPLGNGNLFRIKISPEDPKPYGLNIKKFNTQYFFGNGQFHSAPNGEVIVNIEYSVNANLNDSVRSSMKNYLRRIQQSETFLDSTIVDNFYIKREKSMTQFGLPNNPNYDLAASPPSYGNESDTFWVCKKKGKIYFEDQTLDTLINRAEWSPGNGLSDSTVFAPEILRSDTVTYTMRIFSREFGCEKIRRKIKVLFYPEKDSVCQNASVGPQLLIRPQVTIYPNPVDELLTIKSNFQIRALYFYDMQGRKIAYREPEESSTEYIFDVKEMPKATYLLKVETHRGSVTQRVVVE